MSQPRNRTGSAAWWIVGILAVVLVGVLVIAGILAALLLPAVQAAREAARRTMSMNNLRQFSLAMLNYETKNGTYPARAIFDEHGKPLLSWRVQMLPYLEQNALYQQFHLDEPWDSPHNKPLIAQMPGVYANANRPPDGKTNYLVPIGKGTVFDGTKGVTINDITTGTSNTLLVVEADEDRAVIWTKPDDLEVDFDRPLDGLGNFRPGGFLAAMCDGSVHSFSNTIDPQDPRRLPWRSCVSGQKKKRLIDTKVPEAKH